MGKKKQMHWKGQRQHAMRMTTAWPGPAPCGAARGAEEIAWNPRLYMERKATRGRTTRLHGAPLGIYFHGFICPLSHCR